MNPVLLETKRFLSLGMILVACLLPFWPHPTSTWATTIESGDSANSWAISGQLSTSARWIASAPQSGVIERLLVQEGKSVSADEVIAIWDSELLEAELKIAQASHNAAILEADQTNERKLALLTAKVREADVQQSLEANKRFEKTVSQSEIQKLELQLEQANLTAAQTDLRQRMLNEKAEEKKASIELLALKIDRSKLRSRISGQVVEVLAKEGQWLAEGTPIAVVINYERLRFESLVPWTLARQLRSGQKVRFNQSDQSDNEEKSQTGHPGIIQFVSPEMNPITQQVRVIVEIENQELTLQPGMTGIISPFISSNEASLDTP